MSYNSPIPQKEIPTAYRATGNLIPIILRKKTEDFGIINKQLGLYDSKEHGGKVYTSFKLYYKKPEWEHPNFTIKMQLANNANGKSSVYASMPLEEFKELLSTMIQWLYNQSSEISEFQDISRELLRRHKIEEERVNILKDLSNPTDQLENDYLNQATTNAQQKKQLNNIQLFIKYFKSYFETDNPIHKRQCLDMMLSLLPEHTDEITRLIANYSYSENSNIENEPLENTLEFMFKSKSITTDTLQDQLDQINT